YEGLKVTDAYQNLESPLVVSSPINYTPNKKSLVIKEMTFQLKDQFQQLANITSHPILFLIRDPRLSISSRISKKIAGNLPTDYPLKENGWEDLIKQIRTAEDLDFSYKILDTTQFRIKPEFYIKKLCSIYGIKYKPNMLSWTPKPDLPLDNLNGKHRYLYARVLESTGIEPPIEPIPDISKFSENNDVRAYVNQATLDFHKLKRSRKVIRP
ncbi:MAG: hypothetical protein U9O78_00075, partial [Patescibacteria group bacterium]|nr:hypothetical protein [Patescibacteria group bacterium]